MLPMADLYMETDIGWIKTHLIGCLLDKYSNGKSVTLESETVVLCLSVQAFQIDVKHYLQSALAHPVLDTVEQKWGEKINLN